MKKLVVGVLVLLVFSINVAANVASITSHTFTCDNNCCVEGQSTSVDVTIQNIDPNYMVHVYSICVDNQTLDNKCSIAQKTGMNVSIAPGNSEKFTLTGIVPTPSSGDTAQVRFVLNVTRTCFLCTLHEEVFPYPMEVVAKVNHICSSNSQCSDEKFCSTKDTGYCHTDCEPVQPKTSCGHIDNHEWKEYDCCSDSDCKESNQCVNHKCQSVSCTCGYISNHKCIKYDCCSDSECDANSKCTNNKCLAVSCPCGSISNHACVKYDCCSDSDCGTNSICQNHECSGITCVCGYISGRTCVKYDCCSDTSCNQDQKCQDNKCIAISCSSNQDAINHQCVQKPTTTSVYTAPPTTQRTEQASPTTLKREQAPTTTNYSPPTTQKTEKTTVTTLPPQSTNNNLLLMVIGGVILVVVLVLIIIVIKVLKS